MTSLVLLKVFSSHHEAELAKGLLDEAGIFAKLTADDCGGFRPDLTMMFGVKLFVKKTDEPMARDAVKVLDEEV